MRQGGPSTPRGKASVARPAVRHTAGTVRASQAGYPTGAGLAHPLQDRMDVPAGAKNTKQTAPRRPVFGPHTGPARRKASRLDRCIARGYNTS